MTQDEKILYNKLTKLVNIANQRLARLEKLTGEKESFSAKQLMDYLNSSPLQATTEAGRISLKKNYGLNKLKAIEKATSEFLEDETSTLSGIKNYNKHIQTTLNKTVSVKELSKLYIASQNYEWIYNYFDSEIWDTARESKSSNWSFETFYNTLITANDSLGEENRSDIEAFYSYIMKE